MRTMIRKSAIAGMLASALLIGGCLLSATFVVQVLFRDSDMGDHTLRYHKLVDITTEPDWQDNKDKIHTIELIGFQLWITNNVQGNSFNLYVDDGDDPEERRPQLGGGAGRRPRGGVRAPPRVRRDGDDDPGGGHGPP